MYLQILAVCDLSDEGADEATTVKNVVLLNLLGRLRRYSWSNHLRISAFSSYCWSPFEEHPWYGQHKQGQETEERRRPSDAKSFVHCEKVSNAVSELVYKKTMLTLNCEQWKYSAKSVPRHSVGCHC
jgi:thiamine kinase-like enzyme